MDDKELLNSEESDNSDEWKSWTPKEFLSTTIHELRTPILLIAGYTELLSNEEAKELHPRAIENISQAVRRLEVVIDGMAAYLRELMEKSG